jgi:hypothetical protein
VRAKLESSNTEGEERGLVLIQRIMADMNDKNSAYASRSRLDTPTPATQREKREVSF